MAFTESFELMLRPVGILIRYGVPKGTVPAFRTDRPTFTHPISLGIYQASYKKSKNRVHLVELTH